MFQTWKWEKKCISCLLKVKVDSVSGWLVSFTNLYIFCIFLIKKWIQEYYVLKLLFTLLVLPSGRSYAFKRDFSKIGDIVLQL